MKEGYQPAVGAAAASTGASSNSIMLRTVMVPSFATALVSGGVAGTAVDVVLFPIDTIKTRLQAPAGFAAAGGVRGIYNGLGAAAIGSAPGAALFFATYEGIKAHLISRQDGEQGFAAERAFSHMMAASVGEAAACLVRVPTEVVKAKMQTATTTLSLRATVQAIWREQHGGNPLSHITGGLYRGYGITLFREIPFAAIQFPLYERFKTMWGERQGQPVNAIQAAACGSLAGAVGAGITTPLDVIKTRLMLGVDAAGVPYGGVRDVVSRTLAGDGGANALWRGWQPRVVWIALAGFVFFGAYEQAKTVVAPVLG